MLLFEEILQGIWLMFLEMSPYLLLGFAFAGILHVLIPKEVVSNQIGKKSIWSTIKATLLGVPLPLCSCGVIPTGVSFYRNGASKGATNAFLISTPQTGVDSILITSSLMNWPWAIARPIIALITGVFGGMLTDKLDKDEQVVAIEDCSSCAPTIKKHWLLAIFEYAFLEFLPDISRQLLVGILIAVAITIFVPPTVFSNYLTSPILNMLLVLVASIPLYICATGSVPIAASLLMLGVSPGAVLVFLMAGPATNAATISVLWKSLGKRATLAFLISIVGGALFFGLMMDYVMPSEWFVIGGVGAGHVHGGGASWWAISSAIILMSLIVFVEIRKLIPKKIEVMDNTKTYQLGGMSCNHCKSSVEKNLGKLSNIEEVIVDLSSQTATVIGQASTQDVEQVISELGFAFEGEKK